MATSANGPDVVRRFPDGFVWGAATASYQIEGAVAEDGRTPSIWDTFSHLPGSVVNGDTGDVAADHYHRMPADVAIMAELGLQSYRFSTSWSRVLPHGGSTVNPKGIDFYSRLVDELLAHGIAPLLTLYHWDLPQELQDAGGWTNRETSARFAEYAHVMATHLGDRVRTWTTFNEQWVSAFLGYSLGVHAPGITDHAASLSAVHHLNLAHGLGTQALRAALPPTGQVHITHNLAIVRPATDSPEDIAAASLAEGFCNRVFLQPQLEGHYPADVVDASATVTDFGFVLDGDLANIHQPIDGLGINYYSPNLVAAATPELLTQAAEGDTARVSIIRPTPFAGTDLVVSMPQEGPYTDMGWRIEPGAFTELLVDISSRYPDLPIMVTENGAAYPEGPGPDGRVRDDARTDYLRSHIGAVLDAIEQGADIRGYYVWSLLDNFEWAFGYDKRFGIVYVDYDTQVRTIKDSGRWYADVIRHHGLTD